MDYTYTFAVDAEKLQGLVTILSDGADKIKGYQEHIFSIINSMGDNGDWTGEAYDAFKAQCESYKPAIEGLYYLLLAFKKHFSNLSAAADQLSEGILGIIDSES